VIQDTTVVIPKIKVRCSASMILRETGILECGTASL
jgi:hypothetical protein